MKAQIFTSVTVAVTLLEAVTAIPHGVHRNLHIKKGYTTDVVTEYTTVTVPEYVVWVDEKGDIVSTETKISGFTTSTPTPEPVSSTSDATPTSPADAKIAPASDAAPTTSSAPSVAVPTSILSATPTGTTPVVAPPTSSTEALPAAETTTASQGRVDPNTPGTTDTQGATKILGIAYDVLKGPNPPVCATEAQIASDISLFAKQGYGLVRIYDVTCSQIQLVTKYAAQNNMKVFVTVPSIANLNADLQTVISQAGANLNVIDTIAIGNELVQMGLASVTDIIAALALARNILSTLGYTASIVTVDTFDTLQANPQLCVNSDYCAANCHAFFAPSNSAANAGDYVLGQMKAVSQANGEKRTIITESGWPWAGQANGNAIPSPENQQIALESLKAAFPNGGITLFEAYDAQYKQSGEFGVEPFWGIYGN